MSSRQTPTLSELEVILSNLEAGKRPEIFSEVFWQQKVIQRTHPKHMAVLQLIRALYHQMKTQPVNQSKDGKPEKPVKWRHVVEMCKPEPNIPYPVQRNLENEASSSHDSSRSPSAHDLYSDSDSTSESSETDESSSFVESETESELSQDEISTTDMYDILVCLRGRSSPKLLRKMLGTWVRDPKSDKRKKVINAIQKLRAKGDPVRLDSPQWEKVRDICLGTAPRRRHTPGDGPIMEEASLEQDQPHVSESDSDRELAVRKLGWYEIHIIIRLLKEHEYDGDYLQKLLGKWVKSPNPEKRQNLIDAFQVLKDKKKSIHVYSPEWEKIRVLCFGTLSEALERRRKDALNYQQAIANKER